MSFGFCRYCAKEWDCAPIVRACKSYEERHGQRPPMVVIDDHLRPACLVSTPDPVADW